MARVVECANAEIVARVATFAAQKPGASLSATSKRQDWDITSASVYDATLEIDWYVHIRRRAAAAAVTAAGHLGHAAVLAVNAQTAVLACAMLTSWLADDAAEEPGASEPKPSPAGYLSDTSLRSAAIPAVLMMASVNMPGPSLTVSGSPGFLGGGYEGSTAEARRRLDHAITQGWANGAHRAVAALVDQACLPLRWSRQSKLHLTEQACGCSSVRGGGGLKLRARLCRRHSNQAPAGGWCVCLCDGAANRSST